MVWESNLEGILEKFDAKTIIERINSVPPDAIEETVFYGVVAKGEVDLTNSTAVFELLKRHGIRGTVYTAFIKKHAKPIVERYGGYWSGAKGDNAMYIFADLGNTIRCSVEMMNFIDRVMTPYLVDYIIANDVLREKGSLGSDIKQNEKLIHELIDKFRVIRDVFDDDVPQEFRDLKREYENRYAKTDVELREVLKERRGRLVAKSGIIFGDTEIKVSRDDTYGHPIPDFQGSIPYLESAMNAKVGGPLSGNKDLIVIGSYNPLTQMPEHMDIEHLGKQSYGTQMFHLYRVYGVDNFGHPTFDGRIPDGAPLIRKLPELKSEVMSKVRFLDELENKYEDSSLPSLNITEDERKDRYKNGRTLMMSALTLAIIDGMKEIYNKALNEFQSKTVEVLSPELWYLTNLEFASSIRDFMSLLQNTDGKFRETMLLTSLLYNTGGSMARNTSKTTPLYPIRRLSKTNNIVRLQNEASNAYTLATSYAELKERGVPEILAVQNTPISQIKSSKDAFAALIPRWANRFIHHTSYRAWKVSVESPKQAVIEIRRELSDIINERGYTDRMYWLIEHALTNVLGITEQVQMRRYGG